ncbi:hypothetical protein QFZ23_004310 [Arthrobacter globiformis]|nr:hypothetical protein [Arthrobacter globiformis]
MTPLLKVGELRAIYGGRSLWRIGTNGVENYVSRSDRLSTQRMAPARSMSARRSSRNGLTVINRFYKRELNF